MIIVLVLLISNENCALPLCVYGVSSANLIMKVTDYQICLPYALFKIMDLYFHALISIIKTTRTVKNMNLKNEAARDQS